MKIDDLVTISKNVKTELDLATSGQSTSFPFIVHEISLNSLVSDNEPFQVFVLGGSVFLNATLIRKGSRIHIAKRSSKPLGVIDAKEKFLELISSALEPGIKTIAINFAYPLKPLYQNNKLDGIFVMGSKENTFSGLEGKRVGLELESFIKEKTSRDVNVSIANDTICLLLSGLTDVSGTDIAAGVIGTGMNFAIFKDRTHPVNLEAANFNKFTQTQTGVIIDKESISPGMALMEKEVSGAYLFRHFNLLLEQNRLNYPRLTETKQLDEILKDPSLEVYPIAKKLIETSAGFISTIIAGIVLHKNKDMTFVMEGSLFWSAREFKRNVKSNLLRIIPDYKVTFIKVEDSPIFGAAKLIA